MNPWLMGLWLWPWALGAGPLAAQSLSVSGDEPVMRQAQELSDAARQLAGGRTKGGALPAGQRRFRVLLDPGHTPAHPGAVSSQGRPERDYNQNLAALLLKRLCAEADIEAALTNGPRDTVENADRAKLANKVEADVFLSIHHDSAQDVYLSTWTFEGAERKYCDRFQGFSVHVADDKPKPLAQRSYLLAELVASQMTEQGFAPTLHHAEPIAGEHMKLLDRKLGIYERNELTVFRTNERPAVLVEGGVIVNREEERRLQDPAVQARIVEALFEAVLQFKKRAPVP